MFRDAVVVGNPAMPNVMLASGLVGSLAPLPGAEAEGLAVQRQLRAELRRGANASEHAVRQVLPGAPIIHLATHAFAYSREERARDSFIALGPGDGDDGRLTVGEILDD